MRENILGSIYLRKDERYEGRCIERMQFYDIGTQMTYFQSVLGKIDTLALQNKISYFRKLNISQMSDMEIDHTILDIML